ncbi:MAG: hypothetical protein A3F67_07645 [Verrucomicrobia bacterium RIFCSPHIGHO2_12_FULL_41_10]|nr:MAG: hypothetical protein A3F67_07645 [Verrucomicrobia bacterium RIFCSPHIGHO2_12_FULL_41_10]
MTRRICVLLAYLVVYATVYAEDLGGHNVELAKHLRVFEANREFQLALDLNPHNNIYRSQYAWHLQAFFLIEEALYQFNLLLPLEPDKRLLYQVIGWDTHTLGQWDESISAFSHIYSIPNLTLSYQFMIINKLFRNEQLAKIDEWEKSLQDANPDNALEIKKQIFESYTYIGDLKQAARLSSEILCEHPDEYMVRYRYAHLLYQKKNYSDAQTEFNILITELPNNAFLYWSLGQLLEEMEDYLSAKDVYQMALQLDANPRTKWAVARILSKLQSCSNALDLADKIAVEPSNSLLATLSEAEIYLDCEDYANAADRYRKILSDYPYNQKALWGLLKTSTHTRNSEDARLSYTKQPIVQFETPLQNRLAEFYRQPEIILPAEYYHDSTTFSRFSTGPNYNTYVIKNTRSNVKAYYTLFTKTHFDEINRGSVSLTFDSLFNKYLEGHIELLGNFYNHLQHNPMPSGQPLDSKSVFNYHLHLIYHTLPVFTVDLGYDYYDVIDTVPPFYNPVYNYSNQIGATSLNIRTNDLTLFLNFNKGPVYANATFVYGQYSDHNVKNTRYARAGYRFSDRPSSTVYYNYFYLDFQKPASLFSQNGFIESAYYDPINFEVHEMGADTSYDISASMQLGGEAAVIYVPKCRNSGCAAFGYFRYLFSDRFSCRVDLRFYYQRQGVLRTGLTGDFHAESASLKVNYEF